MFNAYASLKRSETQRPDPRETVAVRMHATRQEIAVIPAVARAMVAANLAEYVDTSKLRPLSRGQSRGPSGRYGHKAPHLADEHLPPVTPVPIPRPISVRIKQTGQVIERMMPWPAVRMIGAGIAELIEPGEPKAVQPGSPEPPDPPADSPNNQTSLSGILPIVSLRVEEGLALPKTNTPSASGTEIDLAAEAELSEQSEPPPDFPGASDGPENWGLTIYVSHNPELTRDAIIRSLAAFDRTSIPAECRERVWHQLIGAAKSHDIPLSEAEEWRTFGGEAVQQ